MKKTLLGLLITISLTACQSQPESVEIDGVSYKRNANGEVVLTKGEVEHLKKNRRVIIVDRVLGSDGVAIDAEDLALISKDKDLMAETTSGDVNVDTYVFALKKGSLKDNLSELGKKYSTEDNELVLDYSGPDYYISESSVIRATSLEVLISEILSDFPVMTSIN